MALIPALLPAFPKVYRVIRAGLEFMWDELFRQCDGGATWRIPAAHGEPPSHWGQLTRLALLWRDPRPVPPWEFRDRERALRLGAFFESADSHVPLTEDPAQF